MTMKRRLLDMANAVIAPAGVQLYHRGIDMALTLKRISRWPGNIGTVIDLGAAKGDWSRMALDYFPKARVVGIDPLEERAGALKRLESTGRFTHVLAAAGAVDGGTAEMSVAADLDSSTVGGDDGEVRSVPVRSIDALVVELELKGPFFLKFDTHGFEVPILDGATATLAETAYIVMEVYNFRHVPGTLLFHEMIALLESKGFRVVNLVDILNRPDDGALWQVDLFFARADHSIFKSNSFRG